MTREEAAKKLRYPKGEKGWVSYYDRAGDLLFSLTSKQNDRSWYFLYRIDDEAGKMVKLGKARTPTELEERYKVIEAMHGPQPEESKPKKSKRVKQPSTKS